MIDNWLMIDRWLKDNWLMFDYWLMVDWWLIDDWLRIGWWLIDDLILIDRWLIYDWLIDWWLIIDWLIGAIVLFLSLFPESLHYKSFLMKQFKRRNDSNCTHTLDSVGCSLLQKSIDQQYQNIDFDHF